MSDAELQLVESIGKNLTNGRVSSAKLETDDRILARITDGIYRQPASALRELIANAYDADATTVYIQTDAPKFSHISVRDDGNGLTIESLASLIYHIGGSPKRTSQGIALGVVNKNDSSLSPKGRRLIGKIGIGLFAVAQLTRQFQIISKTAGTHYRLVAEIILKTYSEDDVTRLTAEQRTKIETGNVKIRAVHAEDESAHGTEIVLLNLRPQTRDLLQSREIWTQLTLPALAKEEEERDQEAGESPVLHIAAVDPNSDDIVRHSEALPWTNKDPPDERFAKLFQRVLDEVENSRANIKLETVLDNYLRTLWTLSLSAPLDYIEKHPFDLTGAEASAVYALTNDSKGQATKLKLGKSQTIRDSEGLSAPERGKRFPFDVFVDDIQLKRPLRFKDLPRTGNVLTQPLLFVGGASPDLSKISNDERGGDLSFEAYFLWTPKVVPREHNGLLIRIADASGTLFDETFMRYQTAEIVLMRQLTAEIFVKKGLDAALNIDRESFNFAHPHYQYVMRWVHRALRQLANTQKALSAELRAERRAAEATKEASTLKKTLRRKLQGVAKIEDLSDVVFAEDSADLKRYRKEGKMAFQPSVVFADADQFLKPSRSNDPAKKRLEAQTVAVAQILEAYGIFREMPFAKQQALLQAIIAIFIDRE